jgi:hypothetical protein
MGHANPFFERAGFIRVGVIRRSQTAKRYGGQFAARQSTCTRETAEKSRYSEPVYYVFDNRRR